MTMVRPLRLTSAGGEFRTYPGAQHRAVIDEEGAVGSESGGYFSKPAVGKSSEKLVEPAERKCRIGRSASKSGSVGYDLAQKNVDRRQFHSLGESL